MHGFSGYRGYYNVSEYIGSQFDSKKLMRPQSHVGTAAFGCPAKRSELTSQQRRNDRVRIHRDENERKDQLPLRMANNWLLLHLLILRAAAFL